MIRVLIVDTELSAGIRIERLLATMKNIEVLGIPTTGADALAVAISASNETDGSSRDDLAPSHDGLSQAISSALARQGGQR